MGSEKNWLKPVSLVILALFIGELFVIIPPAMAQAGNQGPSMNVNVKEIFPGQVILVEITCPQKSNDSAFVASNLHIYVGTTPIAVNPNDVYVLEKGDIYYVFLTATPTTPTTLTLACHVTVCSGHSSNGLAYVKVCKTSQTLYNGCLIYSNAAMAYQYKLPPSYAKVIYNNESKTVSYVTPINLYTYCPTGITQYNVSITYSPPGFTPITITLNNLLVKSNHYKPTLEFTPSVNSFMKEVGYLPFNSSIPTYFLDCILQADPFQGLSCNGTFVYYKAGNYVPAYTAQKIYYPAICTNVEAVNTSIVMDNEYPESVQVFGLGVYTGNFSMETTTVPTAVNPMYATLTPGEYTPAHVTGAQYYTDAVTHKIVKPDTPVNINFEDAFGYSSSLSATTSFSLISITPFSVSVLKPATLTVYDPDNVTNMSKVDCIKVTVALVCKATGVVLAMCSHEIPEMAIASPYFTSTITLSYYTTNKIQYCSSNNRFIIKILPAYYSKTEILINATNGIGASYWIESSTIPVNSSGVGTITVSPSTLSIYSPSVEEVSNTTNVYEFKWCEPNLAFGVPTTLTISGYDVEYNNGVTVANANVTIVFPNGTVHTYGLSKFGINQLTSPTGNGTFFITLLKSEVESAIGLSHIPAGTKIELNIYDCITATPLSAEYVLQVIAPVIVVCTPTAHGTSVVGYIPNLCGSAFKHYVSVQVQDVAYASESPTSVVTATATICIYNATSVFPVYVTSMSLTETGPDTGYFNGTFYYCVQKGKLYIDGNPAGAHACICKLIGGRLLVVYTSPATNQQVYACIHLEIAPVMLSVNTTTAMSGQAVNVTIYAPGLKPAPNFMNIKIPTGTLYVCEQALGWNGYSTTLKKFIGPAYLIQPYANSSMFIGIISLGNPTVTTTTTLGITNIFQPGYTAAPQTTVFFNFTNEISRFSTTTGITHDYHEVSVFINDYNSTFNLGLYNLSIINPPPAGPFGSLIIELTSPIFQYLQHPTPGTSFGKPCSCIIEQAISTIEAKVSGQILTRCEAISIGFGFYCAEPMPFYYIFIPMCPWNGEPQVYKPHHLNVNITDTVLLSGNKLSFNEVTVPCPSRPGVTAIASGYVTYTVASDIATLPIGIAKPILTIYYNGENITDNPTLALSFPNTSTGSIVDLSLYSPSTATSNTSFTVTVCNDGVKTTVTLAEEVINGVYTGYYTGELRVVCKQYYSFYAGQPNVIEVFPCTVNNVSVKLAAKITCAFVDGVEHEFIVSACSYFFVGKIIVKPMVTGFAIISVATGKPVEPTNLTAGQTYELFFNLTNEGTVKITVYAVVEIKLNTTVVLPPEVFVETISPGQTVTFGPEWTPTMAGSYNVSIVLFSNPQLTIPYVPGKYVFTVEVSS
ncbi:MAG: S-layer protein SlaA [Acidianus sp.]|jgi:hypothetical protein|nr:S-layer protein SlaA [Acidianus sp.]